MKINESTLVAFATAVGVQADKEGWLWKKGEVNKAFHKRWFVLKGNLLFYFEKHTDKEPIGVIILEGCIIELAEEDQERFGFKISFHGEKTRVYHLATEFQQSLFEWMRLMACASHDYMKLMVLELEQKLLDLEKIETRAAITSSRSAGAISSLQQEVPKSSSSSTSLQSLQTRQNPFNDGQVFCELSNLWSNYHFSIGQKILKDYEQWYQDHKAIIDISR